MPRFTDADKDLKKAAKAGDLHGVKSALARGGDPDAVSFFGGTALNDAISAKSASCVRAMIEAGAEVNLQAGGTYSTPLSCARAVGTPEIVAILVAAGASDPKPRVPKQFSASQMVELVRDVDRQISEAGFLGLIRDRGMEVIYDFHDCLKGIGAKQTEASVLQFIRTLHTDLGPFPSQKRSLAFIGEHLRHFQAIDEKYRKVREDLSAACSGSLNGQQSADNKNSDLTAMQSDDDVCEAVKDGDGQVLWDGFRGLVLNRSVDFLYEFRDALKAIGAGQKAAIASKVIELLAEKDGLRASEEKACDKLEAAADLVSSLDSQYYDIPDEDTDELVAKYQSDGS